MLGIFWVLNVTIENKNFVSSLLRVLQEQEFDLGYVKQMKF